jgi:hypothetical protein
MAERSGDTRRKTLRVVEVSGFNDWLRLALGDQSPNTFEALFQADHAPASAA